MPVRSTFDEAIVELDVLLRVALAVVREVRDACAASDAYMLERLDRQRALVVLNQRRVPAASRNRLGAAGPILVEHQLRDVLNLRLRVFVAALREEIRPLGGRNDHGDP